MKGRQGALGPTNNSRQENAPSMRPHQMTPQELHEAQSPQDQFSPDINENISGGDGCKFLTLIKQNFDSFSFVHI
jgi:hypothetical protein